MRKHVVSFLLIILASQTDAVYPDKFHMETRSIVSNQQFREDTMMKATELCFVLTSSTTRRDAVAVKQAASQTHCNTHCVGTPSCEACMYYADRGNCVMMGPARLPPPGTCPASYSVYEKRFSGCPACFPPAVDRGYTPGPCSTMADVRAPPVPGKEQVCGKPGPGPERRRLLDAILHGGTRVILENETYSNVFWDQYLCSYYYIVSGIQTYFKCATCVVPPTTPLVPSCACGPLKTEQKIVAGYVADPSNPPTPGDVQLYVKRTRHFITGSDVLTLPSNKNAVFCAMGVWMNINEARPDGEYNTCILLAVTCIKTVAG